MAELPEDVDVVIEVEDAAGEVTRVDVAAGTQSLGTIVLRRSSPGDAGEER